MRTNISKAVSRNKRKQFSLPEGATGGVIFFPIERWEIPKMKYAKPENHRCRYCQARCTGELAEAACMLNEIMWLFARYGLRFTVRQYNYLAKKMIK